MRRISSIARLDEIRLLIVDHQMLCCEGLAALFRSSDGFVAVSMATDIDQAVERAGREIPHVILIDTTLKNTTPYESIRRIQAVCTCRAICFLDRTIHELSIRAAIESGASGYWTKEVEFDVLLPAIRRIAAGQLAYCPESQPFLVHTRRGLRFRPSDRRHALDQLSRREMEVFLNLSRGLTVKQTAQRMSLSHSTVDNHKTRLMKKLGIRKVVDLAVLAVHEGLLD